MSEKMVDKMILTAGPSITQREISYVNDAIMFGHGADWGNYIKRFEEKFAEYIGVKHALATSSCTGAMHLALAGLGIGKGDEVIMPDLSWIATASVVCYTGAEPVFVDVLPDTWCIDPDKIREKITIRTKAIMPVHLYGNVSEMDRIKEIADEFGLYIIEDAAPSIGAEYKHTKTGGLGHVGCFSFQGAKLLSTGEGGMLTTDDTALFSRIKSLSEHGRVSSGFEIGEIGYKYKMSNLQAAWGLAQLERIDELLEKRKLIYRWYSDQLQISGLALSPAVSHRFGNPNYWMVSMVMWNDFGITRDELIQELKQKNIDTRPFFPPISSFRMFKNCDNPETKFLSKNGINLPSFHNINEEEVTYVCNCIKEICCIKE